MKILASTIPQSRFVSAVPVRHQGKFTDSAWIMPGTVNNMLPEHNPYTFLPWTPFSLDAWHAAAVAAHAMGHKEVVIDVEVVAPSLVSVRTNGIGAAQMGTYAAAQFARWVRDALPEGEPKLLVGFYHACPAPPAMKLTEETPDEVEADYATLLEAGADLLRPDFCVLEDYEYGQDWRDDLTFWSELAQRYHPGKPRRVLLNPLDQRNATYIGDAAWRKQFKTCKHFDATPEVWMGGTPAEIADRAWDVAAELTGEK